MACAARNALATAGVEFIDENGGGPGARLRKKAAAEPSYCTNKLLAFFRLPLSQTDPWATAVLVDELDAGRFKCPL